MAKGEIDVYGTLNAATLRGIIAKADQISIDLPNGLNEGQTYERLTEYLQDHVLFKSGEDINAWISAEGNTTPAFFICVSDFNNFKAGHLIYYLGIQGQFLDLTPEGSGSSSSSGKPSLTITTVFKSEYGVNDNINVTYSWISENTGTGRFCGIVDGATVINRRELPMNETGEASRTWEIGKLSRGQHTIEAYVIDSARGQSSKFKTTIYVGGLEVASSFNSSTFYLANTSVDVPFEILDANSNDIKVFGKWDDNEEFEVENTRTLTLSSTQMTEGVHTLYLRAEGYDPESGTLKASSPTLEISIIAAEPGKVYVTPYYNSAQNDSISNIKTEENQQVRIGVNIVEIDGSSYKVKYLLQQDGSDTMETIYTTKSSIGVCTSTLTFTLSGTFKLHVVVESSSGQTGSTTFNCIIDKSSLLSVDPITDGAMLLLSAKGKRNSEDNLRSWEDTSGNNVGVTLKDFNFNSNGWVMNDDGSSKNYLLINSRAYVEVDLEPFINDIDKGLTVDIEFETRDISNVNARVISCYGAPIGFYCNTEVARLGSSGSPTDITYTDKVNSDGTITTTKTGPFEVNFRSGVKTHLTFCIYKYDSALGANNVYPFSCMVMYVNGIMSGIQELTDMENFQTNKWQKIYLGCNPVQETINANTGPTEFENFGEAKIYNLRVYNRALTMEEIVTNYVADIEDLNERDLKVRSNKLGEAVNDSTLVIPQMIFNMYETDFKNITKKDKRKATIQYASNSGTLQNLDSFGLVQWQGTSTLAYAVKNYKVTFYDRSNFNKILEALPDLSSTEYEKTLFENLKEYGKKQKIDIGNGIASQKFTLKADYMDSSSAHNTATAMFVGDLGTEDTPAQEFISAARTAIYGFPMRLVINKIPDGETDASGLPAEELGVKESLGIYNFNLDKGSTDALGLYTKDDLISALEIEDQEEELNEEQQRFLETYPNFDTLSFEISANSDSSSGAFAVSTYKDIITDFEYRFPDEDDISAIDYYGDFVIEDDNLTLNIHHTYGHDEEGNVVPKKYISNNLISGAYTKSGNDYTSPAWMLKYSADNVYTIDNYLAYDSDSGDAVNSTLTLTLVPDETGTSGYVTFTESAEQSYMNSRVHLKRLIDWVLDADDETFYNDFEKHFNLSAVLDYYLTVMALGMVDNLGKNMMLDTYGPVKVGRKFSVGANRGSQITYTEEERTRYDNYVWYPHFYDMD